jgi:hypothetical protein
MESDPEREIGILLRTTQIMVAALILGVLSFYGITIFVVLTNAAGLAPSKGLPLPAIGCGIAAVTMLFSFAVKGLILRRAKAEARDTPHSLDLLLQRYRTANIVAGALCEGGAFAVGVFVIVSGPGSLPWLAGGLISLLGFALHFPSREKLDAFLAESRSGDESSASE